MASAFLGELKAVVTKVKRRQIEDEVGSSCAALVTEEDPQGRGVGTLLVEAREEGGGGRGGGERRDGGAGRWGVLKSDKNVRISWQLSLKEKMS